MNFLFLSYLCYVKLASCHTSHLHNEKKSSINKNNLDLMDFSSTYVVPGVKLNKLKETGFSFKL